MQYDRIHNCFRMNNYLAKKYNVVQVSHTELGILVVFFAHICEQLFKGNFQAIFLDRCKPSLCKTENKALN